MLTKTLRASLAAIFVAGSFGINVLANDEAKDEASATKEAEKVKCEAEQAKGEDGKAKCEAEKAADKKAEAEAAATEKKDAEKADAEKAEDK